MKYVAETQKSVEQAEADLCAAVQRHKFGVLHIHDLQETMKKKGVAEEVEVAIIKMIDEAK
jgi:uncharacterized protein (DUF302 family)